MAGHEAQENRNCQWSPVSSTALQDAERKILSYLKRPYRGRFVDIGPVVGSSDKIWTISLNEDSRRTPILLLHGFGAGVAFWCFNLDALSASRPVYAIDLLGFGRSSRPKFSSDGLEAESQLVQSVEAWRHKMQLDKIILLGHSMGGFLAASYAIKYPDRVRHLILADPWGFSGKPKDFQKSFRYIVFKVLTSILPVNPLWIVRFAGPFGQRLIEKARSDIIKKFDPAFERSEDNVIGQYIYQCNAQEPSGEGAFSVMTSDFAWAKYPMIDRIDLVRADVPITCLYGSQSWVYKLTSESIKDRRPASFVDEQVISGASHHVYADRVDVFNNHVEKACQQADNEVDFPAIQSNSTEPNLRSQSNSVEK